MERKAAVAVGKAPVGSPARKITAILFAAQCLGSAGFIAMSTVGAILAAELSGKSWAGVPSAASALAGAGAAFLWGYLMDSLGRRGALALGILCGALGASASIFAIVHGSFFLLVAGMVLVGIAQAAMTLSRFVAAEVNPPERRGRAISYVVLGGTAGAILGPLLVAPSGRLMTGAGISELAGAFAAAAILLAAAGATVLVGLRPDPRELGRALAESLPRQGGESPARSIREILRQPVAVAAVVSMVLSQVVMVAVMVITSLYMKDMHHDLADVSIVFSAHTIGMYAFSLLSGRLADRWGRAPVIITGALVLIVACLTASLTAETFPIAGSLLLLGLGWNFCFVGGSALLSDQLAPAERAHTQGFNDLLVGLAAGIGSFGSGVVSSAIGYLGVGLTGAVLSLVPLVLVASRARAIRKAAI
jgi:MFS family permease